MADWKGGWKAAGMAVQTAGKKDAKTADLKVALLVAPTASKMVDSKVV